MKMNQIKPVAKQDVTMSFHDIEYQVEKSSGKMCGKEMKTILSGLRLVEVLWLVTTT